MTKKTIEVEMSKEDLEDIIKWFNCVESKDMDQARDWVLKKWLEIYLEILKKKEGE